MLDIQVQSSLGKCMFFGLSGLWCGQLRAVVRGSAADDGDDSAAYWPVTPLSAVIAALTDTDHPLFSGQNTFIILLTFFFPTTTSKPEARKKYIQSRQSTRSNFEEKGCYRFAGGQKFCDSKYLVYIEKLTAAQRARVVVWNLGKRKELPSHSFLCIPFPPSFWTSD